MDGQKKVVVVCICVYTNLMVACIEVPITNTRSSATYCVISSTFYVVVFLNSTRCTNTKIIREDLLRAHRGTCKIIQDKNTRIIVLFKVQNLNFFLSLHYSSLTTSPFSLPLLFLPVGRFGTKTNVGAVLLATNDLAVVSNSIKTMPFLLLIS